MSEVLQSAGADPVPTLFVFLNLLESEAKRIAELLLAHSQQHTTHSNPAPHMLVRGIRQLLWHDRPPTKVRIIPYRRAADEGLAVKVKSIGALFRYWAMNSSTGLQDAGGEPG